MDWAGDHLPPLVLHNKLQYYLWLNAEIIFRYQKVIFGIPKLLWDDIRSYHITEGWMLTSSLKIQQCFMIFLNLTKLSQEQKRLKFYTLVLTVFIIILNIKNNIFGLWCLESMLSYLSFKAFDKLDLGNFFFKYASIPVRMYFQTADRYYVHN